MSHAFAERVSLAPDVKYVIAVMHCAIRAKSGTSDQFKLV